MNALFESESRIGRGKPSVLQTKSMKPFALRYSIFSIARFWEMRCSDGSTVVVLSVVVVLGNVFFLIAPSNPGIGDIAQDTRTRRPRR